MKTAKWLRIAGGLFAGTMMALGSPVMGYADFDKGAPMKFILDHTAS